MTVAQLLQKLGGMPEDAVVLMEDGDGFSSIGELEIIEGRGPGAPTEVILLASIDD